jgi:glycosyltransferase involved in cell wall biosynthesis
VGWSGGMEQMSLLMAGLEGRGHQNVLVCPPGSELIQKISKAVQVYLLPMFQDYDLIAAWKLNRLIRTVQPDVVHAHHPMAHAIALVALSFGNPTPLVVSRRVSFSLRKNPFSQWKYQSSRIHKYSVVSHAVQQTLVQGGVPESKIEVIYSAVNPNSFIAKKSVSEIKQELKIQDGFWVAGKVANYSVWKGQHIFLQAAKRILSHSKKVIFVLAGKGTETLIPMVRGLGIEDFVRLLGFRKDIPELIPIFDVSVNSAVEGEGLSGAVRESFFLNVPVVASEVSGNKEIVKNGETGFLVSVNDPDALAKKIMHALENKTEAKKLALNGHQWVMENATVDTMVERFINLYSSVMEKCQR